MVLDAGHGGALHGAGVVQLPAALPHEVGMVSSTEDPRQKHLEIFYHQTWVIQGPPRNDSTDEILRLIWS